MSKETAREYWLSLYWQVSGDRDECALETFPHLHPLHPHRERMLGFSRAKLATWKLTRTMQYCSIGSRDSGIGLGLAPRIVVFRRRGVSGL